MIKQLLTTFKKDMSLALRSFYIYLILVFAFVFVLIMLVAVPEDTKLELPFAIAVEDNEALYELSNELYNYKGDELIVKNSRQELMDYLDYERALTGMYISYSDGTMNVEYIVQGYEHERMINLVESEIMAFGRLEAGNKVDIKTTVLRENSEKLSIRNSLIPVFIVMESALMGLFLVAAYVFMEKQEGTIKAFCVSPAKVWQFIASKTLVFLVFGLISSILTLVILLGFDYNVLQTFLLIIIFNSFGTLLGLFFAVFFDSLQSSMIVILFVATILSITTISYLNPSFSPAYVKFLPTYPMQFALREALIGDGNVTYVWENVLMFLGIDIILFYVCSLLYKKRISRF